MRGDSGWHGWTRSLIPVRRLARRPTFDPEGPAPDEEVLAAVPSVGHTPNRLRFAGTVLSIGVPTAARKDVPPH